ncbi:MAG: N-6 DNA methylase [Thermodesulfovibrionales bacterium]|nr:N-6 DNA methylase [Thermodesulfovibrionales bacterium]
MPKKKHGADNLPLLPDIIPSWETNGIFSDHFIRSRLKEVPLYPADDEYAKPLFDYIKELWEKKHIILGKNNEELTKREFLEKIFNKLGYAFIPARKLPVTDKRREPDYLFFQDKATKEKAFTCELIDQYRLSITLLEAKKVNHPLDEVSKKETPGKFPHQQVRDYLSYAADQFGNPFFKWAILTNGGVWRLYNRDSHPSAYFQFRLAGEKYFCSYEDFKIFLTLFRPEAFITTNGICPLDDIRKEAIQYQTALEEDLRKRIFTVIKDLANGFWSYKGNNIPSSDLPKLYDYCLIFLYRLLFVLYAESRGLLPVKSYGAGSNKNYRERYSLQKLIPKLRQELEYQSDEFTELYEQLLSLFHLINGDQPSRNKTCNVPRYNGGLFDNNRYPELDKWRIGERSLSYVLKDLMFSSGPSQKKGQQEFEFGTIDYADLEVRQLGDIYEGLLGGSLEVSEGRLTLNEEYKKRQSTGTFYTPDYIVRFIVEKTIASLIERIERSEHVQSAIDSGKKDNSFANAVLELNILDPAMGSGHFLVRATEWLADRIVEHPTTKFQIKAAPPGVSQEQAEISYWRRRVVEACIYGVDNNPLAVELTKLSLWLTCIASDEPLNFLDHHLRVGNSLIGTKLDDIVVLPSKKQTIQLPFSFGPNLPTAVASAIQTIESIEAEASTSLEIVKRKEMGWQKEVLGRLLPFKTIGDIWIATTAGLKLYEMEYHDIANYLISPQKQRIKGKNEWLKIKEPLAEIREQIHPFHWELEFPDVFFDKNGIKKADTGFDAVLGNPPYISTQSSSGFAYREGLEYLFGFADDLYVHFVFKGFNLLKQGGMFGFIISDTFFTLSTKQRLRELFQDHCLSYLVQCDPFKATVDTAIFVAEKTKPKEDDELVFIQARYKTEKSAPETELLNLIKGMPKFGKGETGFKYNNKDYPVYHTKQGCLRIHKTNIEPFRKALKQAFFEPADAIVRLYNRFIEPMTQLTDKWWDKIETSKKFSQHKKEILEYHKTLKPVDVTLVGLIAEGGQGMKTGNNGRFLGYLKGTEQAQKILERQKELIEIWNSHSQVKSVFTKLMRENDNDFESVVETLKSQFNPARDLGLKRGEIYRVVDPHEIANPYEWDDAARTRVIHEGLEGYQTWVPFRKGDPEGNKWIDDEPLFINWSKENVKYLQNAPEARWQGYSFFFSEGVTYTLLGNHTSLKARLQPRCVFEAGGSRLLPIYESVSVQCFLSILNSDFFSFLIKKFINHTTKFELNNLRMSPIIIPTMKQASELETLARKAVEAKDLTFKKAQPSKELVDFCQALAEKQKSAPSYLRPSKQLQLISTPDDCLNIIELAVHWAVERLYGVEGYGPFNEF